MQKHAENDLIESESRFRKIVEQAPIAMAIVGMDEVIEFINRKAITVFGYPPQDIPTMDRWWAQAYPDEKYRKEVIADWTGRVRRALTDGGEIIGNEYRVTCKNGAVKTMFISGVPVSNKIFVMFDDITERKRSEEALRESEERYRRLVETTDTGYVIIDVKGKVLDANLKYVHLSGHETLNTILGRNVLEWTADEEKESNAKAVAACLKNGSIRNFEVNYVDKNGKRTPVEINAAVIDAAGTRKIVTLCRDISARKKAEEALRESEERFSKSFMTSPYAYMIAVQEDGRILEVNDAFVSLSGFSREEALASSTLDLKIWVREEDRRRMVAILRENGTVENFETMVRLKNGNIRTVLFFARLIQLGDKFHVVSIVQDITDRKQTEIQRKAALEELRLRESYLSAIIENLPGLLWMKDRKGKFLAVNTTFAVSCGLNDPGLLVGKTDFDIWPRDLAAGYVAADERVMQSGKPFMVEEPISVTGDVQWFETFKTPIRDGQGTIIGTTGYSHDITERKKAADALLASELKYRELANTVPIGIFECAPDGKLIFANTILFKWFGYAEADILAGINVLDFIDAQDRERAVKNIARASDPPSLLPNEYCGVRKDGSTLQVLILSRPRIVNGQTAGRTGILLDLTEKKQMEAAIQNATRLESLGVLAGGIAHDFNNLLGGIFGYLSLANVCVAGGKFENVPEYLTKALDVFGRARSLTQQLLTFSRGGAPVRKTLQLAPLLKKWTQFALSGSNVVCRCSIAHDLRLCDCDENQIGQVIDNIVINAKQAMPMGGEIVLTAQNSFVDQAPGNAASPGGDYVKISIKDHGIGIPKQILTRIFDPFFSTKDTGHGLGLTTCYSIISRHGGFIDVESEPGKGSVFHIFLPASINFAHLPPEDGPAMHKGSGTFLIMDDEEMIRRPIGDVLKLWGYNVVCTETGSQTIDFLLSEIKANRKLTGMILDLTIPGGMGGKDAIREIRKLSPELPVFVASGYANDPVMANPKDFGFTASIRKPFTVHDLARMLNEHLKT